MRCARLWWVLASLLVACASPAPGPTETPPPALTPLATRAVPSPLPTNVGLSVQVVESHLERTADGYDLVGTVRNTGTAVASGVRVTATLFFAAGSRQVSAPVTPASLAPGEQGQFRLRYGAPTELPRRHELTVQIG